MRHEAIVKDTSSSVNILKIFRQRDKKKGRTVFGRSMLLLRPSLSPVQSIVALFFATGPNFHTSPLFQPLRGGAGALMKRSRHFASTTPPSKKSAPNSSSFSAGAPRTNSFGVLAHPTIPPHTLILGSHPSVQSLQNGEYYGHRRNAFWWIAGDALGFRRGVAGGPSKEITPLHPEEKSLPYTEQVQQLLEAGFAVWDVVGQCERKGSLDADIKNAVPNPLQEWVASQPSLKRICFSTGASTADLFIKYHRKWLCTPGKFSFSGDELTQRKFKRFIQLQQGVDEDRRIRLCVMPSVSPAYAKMSYRE